jgi:hypothetical protein
MLRQDQGLSASPQTRYILFTAGEVRSLPSTRPE